MFRKARNSAAKVGEIFVVYRTGTLSVQGKPTALARDVEKLGGFGKGAAVAGVPESGAIVERAGGSSNQVFIVYGHDIAARDALELLLRRMGLDPVVLQNLPAAGDTVIEKLERYLGEHGNVGYACVLLTPDDEGHKAPQTREGRFVAVRHLR